MFRGVRGQFDGAGVGAGAGGPGFWGRVVGVGQGYLTPVVIVVAGCYVEVTEIFYSSPSLRKINVSLKSSKIWEVSLKSKDYVFLLQIVPAARMWPQ